MLGDLTAPAKPSSMVKGGGEGDCQVLKTSWPLVSTQKGTQKKTKLPEDTNIRVGTRSGE